MIKTYMMIALRGGLAGRVPIERGRKSALLMERVKAGQRHEKGGRTARLTTIVTAIAYMSSPTPPPQGPMGLCRGGGEEGEITGQWKEHTSTIMHIHS
jgi:hypothetical protein